MVRQLNWCPESLEPTLVYRLAACLEWICERLALIATRVLSPSTYANARSSARVVKWAPGCGSWYACA